MPFLNGHRSSGLALALLAGAALRADVSLPAIFSAHAVLQRDARVPIWGKAAPDEEVALRVAGRSARARADQTGHWRTALDLSHVGDGPHELVVRGRNEIVVPDVLVGEVWLCAGQSNMEWALAATDRVEEELARPANPRLRQFLVRRTGPASPAEDCVGNWIVAAPETVGRFSGVAYHFGRRIGEATGRGVGLINIGAGGTAIEGWMSAELLARDTGWQPFAREAARYAAQYPELLRNYTLRVDAWLERHQRRDPGTADPGRFAAPGTIGSGWETVAMPGDFAGAGVPPSGAIWLRRIVRVPQREAIGLERGFQLSLGVIRGANAVYWNGEKIGETDLTSPGVTRLRRYVVPPALIQRGMDATLAIRIFYPQGGVRLTVPPDPPLVANTVPLDGDWRLQTEFAFPDDVSAHRDPFPLPPAPPAAPVNRQFNGLIAPLVPYALRGVIWYQGETNAPRAAFYSNSFALMLADWRARWNRGDFPCYFAQLANFNAKLNEPGDSDWAELREAQTKCLALPNTGQAVTIDLGEELEIHPRNKREVGERLARLALTRTYGEHGIDSGPMFKSAAVEGASIRIRFYNTDGGLLAHPLPKDYPPTSTRPGRTKPLRRHAPAGELEGFAICGKDQRWVWASATIEGETVVVSSPGVTRPIAVRYAWSNNPTCNLYNGEGLPAAPFRTDDFPLTTAKPPSP